MKATRFVLLALCVLGTSAGVTHLSAQTVQTGQIVGRTADQTADQNSNPAADRATTVQVYKDAITEYRLPSVTLEKSEALYHTSIVMFVVGTIYGLAVLALILALRIGPTFRDIAERVSHNRFVQVILFAPLLLLSIDVLSLPLSIYAHYLRHSYGLSVQGWGSWFWDWTKGELVGTVIATLLVWGLYAIVRHSPKRWWLYVWFASIPVVLLLVLIQPIFIDPLFNSFSPLESKQPELLTQIERVMQRGGISIDRSRMFEMHASDKETTYNAYVTGIGSSKRVVVWDNTARDMSIPETLFVFGHEQGHYALNHIWKLLAFSIGGLLLGLYLAYRLIGKVLARFGSRWKIRDLGDWASLPALMLLFSIFSLLGQPVSSTFTRYFEHQADVYGLEVIHGLVPDSSQVAAHAFQLLGEKGLSYPNPHPLFVFWAYSHPPIRERIQFAIEYRPWDSGTATAFVD